MDPDQQPSNPYASVPQPGYVPPDPSQPHYSSIVQQVMPYGILLMVNGGLLVLMGLVLVAIPGLVLTMADGNELDDEETLVVVGVYGVMGLVLLIGGALQLWGGWRAIHFRSFAWTVVGLASAAMGSLTCYCAPTGIALGVWGLILLLNRDVQYAFQLGKTQTREQVMQHFSYRGDQWAPPGQPPTNPPQGGMQWSDQNP